MRTPIQFAFVVLVLTATVTAGCGRRRAPVPQPVPAPRTTAPPAANTAPAAPERVEESLPVPPQPVTEETVANRSLDDLNRNSPLKPVFFALDSADLDDTGRVTITANADVLKRNPTWVVTVEGHCDERGTPEYNLALGERRAATVKSYLESLGVGADRVNTVSFGKEFPFDPGHNEEAWSQNRRGHFVITAR